MRLTRHLHCISIYTTYLNAISVGMCTALLAVCAGTSVLNSLSGGVDAEILRWILYAL